MILLSLNISLYSHLVVSVFRKELRDGVPTATSNMDERSFLAEHESRRDSQRHRQRLDQQRSKAEIAFHYEARKNCFDLRNPRAARVRRDHLDENHRDSGEKRSHQAVHNEEQHVAAVGIWISVVMPRSAVVFVNSMVIVRPAALLLVQVQVPPAVPRFQVGEPSCRDVDHTSGETG
jgi:hypothetical protein